MLAKRHTSKMRYVELVTYLKDIVSIIAVFCVGIWAIYISVIKNEELKSDLEVLALEQNTNISPQLSTSIRINHETDVEMNRVYSIYVTLKNTGEESVRVYLNKESLLMAEVELKNNSIQYGHVTYLGGTRFTGVSNVAGPFLDIGANESYELAYLSTIKTSGIYLFRFLSKISSAAVDKRKIQNLGDNSFTYYSVGVDRFLSVE